MARRGGLEFFRSPRRLCVLLVKICGRHLYFDPSRTGGFLPSLYNTPGCYNLFVTQIGYIATYINVCLWSILS